VSNLRAWTALGFASIYYVLDKLAKRGSLPEWRTQAAGMADTRCRSVGHAGRACVGSPCPTLQHAVSTVRPPRVDRSPATAPPTISGGWWAGVLSW